MECSARKEKLCKIRIFLKLKILRGFRDQKLKTYCNSSLIVNSRLKKNFECDNGSLKMQHYLPLIL